MRIISGKYKGKTLKTIDGDAIRPTTDRAKEGIFNVLQGKIINATVLDLFSGTGSIGIECLSRGARKVVFSDIDKKAIDLIKSNLTGVDYDYEIINKDYLSVLKQVSISALKFDLIFIDPPYDKGYETEILAEIEKLNILSSDGIIVLERREKTKYSLPCSYILKDTKNYAISYIDFLQFGTKGLISGTFDPFTNGHLFLVEEALKLYDIVHIIIFVNPEKATFYTLKQRLEFVSSATKNYKKRLIIGSCDGYVVEYCKQNGIKNIIRGYRNESDLKYEEEMADYNFKNGNCKTLILKSNNEICSTFVKTLVLNNDINALNEVVDKKIIKSLLKK